MAIRACIFDLGQVIVPFDWGRAVAMAVREGGVSARAILGSSQQGDLMSRFERGEISGPDFARELGQRLGWNPTYEVFCRIWNCIFDRQTLIPEWFFSALARNHRLVLLSNTNEIHFEMIRREYPLLRHFHEFVLSYEARSVKPDRKIFEEAVRRSRALPGECFFTDDTAGHVKAARSLDIDAALFSSFKQLKAELAKRGVAPAPAFPYKESNA